MLRRDATECDLRAQLAGGPARLFTPFQDVTIVGSPPRVPSAGGMTYGRRPPERVIA
jgi:hypothetical protein